MTSVSSSTSTSSNTTRGCACGATGLSPTAIYCDGCLRSMGLYDNNSNDHKNVPSVTDLGSSNICAPASSSKSITIASSPAAPSIPREVVVSTLTSSARKRGYLNSEYAMDALFALPYHCCWDNVGQRLLICDSANHRLRVIQDGVVSEIAAYNEPSRRAYPCGVTVDRVGNIYITESHRILRIVGDDMTVLAGNDRAGFVDGTGADARFNDPRALAVDIDGNVFVADYFNKALRKWTAATGMVTTLTKGGWPGNMFNHANPETKSFDYPAGVTIDRIGNILVCDGPGLWVVGQSGDVSAVAVNYPTDTTRDPSIIGRLAAVVSHPTLGGHIFVADTTYNCIRKITLDSIARIEAMMAVDVVAGFPPGILPLIASYFPVVGEATIFAGSTRPGIDNGIGEEASFNTPRGLALDHITRTLYVTDTSNHAIRTISF